MPDTNNISQNGLWFRWRLFRNRGRMQIIGVDKLHFSSVPYFHNHYISKTVLLHLGYLDKDKREQKYKFYDREDKEKLMDYSYILSEKIELQALSQITNDYFKVKQVINDERI